MSFARRISPGLCFGPAVPACAAAAFAFASFSCLSCSGRRGGGRGRRARRSRGRVGQEPREGRRVGSGPSARKSRGEGARPTFERVPLSRGRGRREARGGCAHLDRKELNHRDARGVRVARVARSDRAGTGSGRRDATRLTTVRLAANPRNSHPDPNPDFTVCRVSVPTSTRSTGSHVADWWQVARLVQATRCPAPPLPHARLVMSAISCSLNISSARVLRTKAARRAGVAKAAARADANNEVRTRLSPRGAAPGGVVYPDREPTMIPPALVAS